MGNRQENEKGNEIIADIKVHTSFGVVTERLTYTSLLALYYYGEKIVDTNVEEVYVNEHTMVSAST